MNYAVIGSTGQLGSDLLAFWGDNAVGVSHDEIELTDADSVDAVIGGLSADVVVNAAAYNRVDDAETSEHGRAVNALGPQHLARACAANGVKLVQVGTDFVFGKDTERASPYAELDKIGPVNLYGLSKLTGELFVQGGSLDNLVVRTCGLYGHAARERRGGGNFVETMLRLAGEGTPIRVVDDQRCTPTSTLALAAAIDALIAAGCRGLYHATCSGSVTWCEFARAVFRLAGLDVEVEAITSAELAAAAQRPGYSVLDCSKLADDTGHRLPEWETALAEYLSARDEP